MLRDARSQGQVWEGSTLRPARAQASMNTSRVVSPSEFHALSMSQHWRLHHAVTTLSRSVKRKHTHFRTFLVLREHFLSSPPGNHCNSYACTQNLRNLNIDFAAVGTGVNGLGRKEIGSNLTDLGVERALRMFVGYRRVPVANEIATKCHMSLYCKR